MISGHKTFSIFECYNIVNAEDLKKASQRVRKYREERLVLQNGHNWGTPQAQEAQIQPDDHPVIH